MQLDIPPELAARMMTLARQDGSAPDPIRRALAVIEADVTTREKVVRQNQIDEKTLQHLQRVRGSSF